MTTRIDCETRSADELAFALIRVAKPRVDDGGALHTEHDVIEVAYDHEAECIHPWLQAEDGARGWTVGIQWRLDGVRREDRGAHCCWIATYREVHGDVHVYDEP